jgi:two-component system chemotaxis response regulator CheY
LPRVLVVEDDLPIASIITYELEAEGYEVVVARNGLEALDSVERARPDAIVLDLMMPVISGWHFIEQYRAHVDGEVIPIVIVSAAGAVPQSMTAFGVRHFLPKPFDLQVLMECVADVTGRR